MASYTPNTWTAGDTITKTKLDRLEAGTAAALPTADAPELIRDTMGTALVAGANVTLTVNDAGDTITVASSGGGTTDVEVVRDTIAAALVAGTNVTITPNDGADTITIAATGGGSATAVQDEGSALTARSTINFVGAGVTATDDAANSRTLVTIPGGGSGISVQDENGTAITGVTQLDFQGAGVTAAAGTGEVVVTIPGGGGGTAVTTLTRSGFYMTMPGALGTVNPSVGSMSATPLLVPACTVDRIGLEILSAAGAGGVVRLGIYADSGSMSPGNLILDAGTIDATTIGYKEITISQALTAGFVWLTAVGQVAVAVNGLRGTAQTPYVISHTAAGLSGNPITCMASTVSTVTGALPTPFGASQGGVTAPRILLRAV